VIVKVKAATAAAAAAAATAAGGATLATAVWYHPAGVREKRRCCM